MSIPPRWLSGLGAHAEIDEDALVSGAYILSISGAQQSHVDLGHPEHIFYEYLRRIANVIDLVCPPAEPLKVLHLGAGALTLVRYIQATRPGSAQWAVERERELIDFVLRHLPLPSGTTCECILADVSTAVATLQDQQFDAVVLDIFADANAPSELTGAGFQRRLMDLITPEGVLLINVGDDPPLAFAREQARALRSCAAGAAVLTEQAMIDGERPGNLILVGTARPWAAQWTAVLDLAGPHPGAVLTDDALDRFIRGAHRNG